MERTCTVQQQQQQQKDLPEGRGPQPDEGTKTDPSLVCQRLGEGARVLQDVTRRSPALGHPTSSSAMVGGSPDTRLDTTGEGEKMEKKKLWTKDNMVKVVSRE